MQTPLPYVAPSKGLIRSLQAEVQALAHERLAQHLRWYQKHFELDDEQIAARMNACVSVIGIRARKDDVVHAPISAAKISRFKDGRTKPQRQTLDQMTAFFAQTLGAKPFLYWADMDDVLTAFHDARRFRKERMPKGLIALTKGWINADLKQPHSTLALQLSPLSAAPVILVRGRMVTHKANTGSENLEDHADVFLHGYGTLTPDNLNLYVRDENGRQIIVYMDVAAGPVINDPERVPYLFIKQTTLSLPPAFDPTDRPHPYRLRAGTGISDEELQSLEKRRPGDPIRPYLLSTDAIHMNERNAERPDFDQFCADLVFAIEPGKTWSTMMVKTKL
jgi:hypothetical protein